MKDKKLTYLAAGAFALACAIGLISDMIGRYFAFTEICVLIGFALLAAGILTDIRPLAIAGSGIEVLIYICMLILDIGDLKTGLSILYSIDSLLAIAMWGLVLVVALRRDNSGFLLGGIAAGIGFIRLIISIWNHVSFGNLTALEILQPLLLCAAIALMGMAFASAPKTLSAKQFHVNATAFSADQPLPNPMFQNQMGAQEAPGGEYEPAQTPEQQEQNQADFANYIANIPGMDQGKAEETGDDSEGA